jgi:hypothetical protein
MAQFSKTKINSYFKMADKATTSIEKGRALENLICYLFMKIPGIEIVQRDILSKFRAEEIDIALWNNQNKFGVFFLPFQILIECKNWSTGIGSQEVAFFVTKLKHRGLNHGILITANGITGNPADSTSAHFQVTAALQEGIRLIVITRSDIEALMKTADFIRLMKMRLTELVASGTYCGNT